MALSALISVLAAALLVVLLLGWSLQRLTDRRAARNLPHLDPYYAAALSNPIGLDDLAEPATAALLRAGLITIDDEGMVTVVAGSGEPEHRIEAAVLAWYATADEPVTLRRATQDAGLRARRDEFVRDQARQLPRRTRPMKDYLRGAALLIVISVSTFYAVQVIYFGANPVNKVGAFLASIIMFLTFWLLILVPAVWIAYKIWPKRRNLLQEHCAALLPHPAVAALSTREAELVAASRAYETPAEKEWRAAELREAQNFNTGSDI